MKRLWATFACMFMLGSILVGEVAPASGQTSALSARGEAKLDSVPVSGATAFRDSNFGTGITECPQAGLNGEPDPLDRREIDEVERISDRGDDVRPNDDFSCFPHDETSIDTNPLNERNIVGGANDYRLGFGSSGAYASTDGGRNWYNAVQPFPSLPNGDNLDGGGDPAITFDSEGVVYYAEINFNRTDDTNGIFVMRSTNGGFTWTRACVPIDTTPEDPTDDASACGGIGDPRQPGDGVVSFQQDQDSMVNGSVPFDDKEYIASGPRPDGVEPVCFTPIQRAPRPCDPDVVGSERLYVTWTRFTATSSEIQLSYSDDQARSWSPRKSINGSAAFCTFGAGSACDFNQFSVPTVHEETGSVGVAFENFNTPDENQYLFVRSDDGGNTFQGPFFVTPVFDRNFPRAGITRPDCTQRGQQRGRIVYTNSCFRSNAGGNVVFDRRGGAFADDLYLVMSDNRNGTSASSNADVFIFKSTDGGQSWVGPTRVNDDRSELTGSRDDPDNDGDFGNDQWWPWVDIGSDGDLNFIFHDRRLDTDSIEHEWPTSRERPGNYLVWTWGAQCRVRTADSRDCLAPGAEVIPQPTAPIDPGDDPVPGQGDEFVGPIRNFQVSDVPSNFDYSFRAGIFAGDYNNIAVGDRGGGRTAYAFWTDARNGRSSGGPAGGSELPSQPGRNPACEQSDVFFDSYSARNGGKGGRASPTDSLFLVTLCPSDAVDDRQGDDGNDDDDDDD